jgi:hypothetical protein
MKIAETHSHLNGLEYLLVRRPTLWQEIQSAVADLDASKCLRKLSKEKTAEGQLLFSPGAMSATLRRLLRRDGWGTPISGCNQTDFVKDRVAVEVQFGKYALVAYDLYVKHLAFYIGDHIDVGVEILPMKSLQSQMSSGVAYYEDECYNVIRQGRGVPAVPLVLIGIEP